VLGFIAEDVASDWQQTFTQRSVGRALWRGLQVERRGGVCRSSVVAGRASWQVERRGWPV